MAKASVNFRSSSASSVFNSPPLNQSLNQITSIKLDRGNYLRWKSLVMPILRSYKMEGHLTGENLCPQALVQIENAATTTTKELNLTLQWSHQDQCQAPQVQLTTSTANISMVNPLIESWVVVNQLLLGWLYNFMTPEMATQIMGYENARDLWKAILELLGVQSRAEEDLLRQTH